jgi:membrane-bound lytic murein transglycosylase MltF
VLLAASCTPEAPAESVQAAAPPAVVAGGASPAPASAPPEAAPADDVSPLVLRLTQPDTSDWPAIVRRGVLRVLVVRDRTNFFIAAGHLRGFEYELCVELEKAIADSPGSDRPRVDVAFVPVALDELIPALVAGRGDVAAGALTITPERERLVAFTEPYVADVAQVVVSHRGAPPLASLDDLAGRGVCVAPGTSYLESLARLNARFAAEGREPVRVDVLGRGVVTEDVLELVHSGAFLHTVVDRHVAEMWAGALSNLRVEPTLRLTEGDRIAWAVRRENPELRRVLDAFLRENRRGTTIGNVLFARYLEGTRWIVDPEPDLRSGRLAPFLDALQRLSAQYGFD